ncbi:ribosomal L35Ae [Tubulinosema ratisbonensis]|uniref:Ribosomal L35Ae n=1 Tax=Tubulinosema ratisbonensis TaxID=291195 RepID=A0A437AKL7_9MICR|nr:ribosomal L35Ae [Tubulinosema ratisbonensis]
MSTAQTSLEAIFISHKRGQRRIHPNRSLLRVEGIKSRDTAQKFIGNAVISEYKKDGQTYINKGMITNAHGNSGVLRAKFERNLPPQMVGKKVYLKLYKVEDLSY